MAVLTKIGDYDVRPSSIDAGVVRYEATHVLLPRRATIERVEASAPRSAAIRMMRHACILEALHHSGVPRVYECGRVDGLPWVAFERIDGAALETELRSRRLDGPEVLDLIVDVAAILTDAHARGVLHRDITPSVIIRTANREHPVVLAGWDSACTLDTELATPLKGSPRYRAPELIHDLPADGRVDVFALGMVCYEALTGELPLLSYAPEDAAEPTTLATLIRAMLSDDPVKRPTAAEVATMACAIREQTKAASASAEDEVYASVEIAVDTAREIERAIEDQLQAAPRVKPRWTPQWALEERAAAGGLVEIVPRRMRDARDDGSS
ncbi:MAG TPA: protein kinase [Kofleriaceae bacterium]